jgi:hypothetical protein
MAPGDEGGNALMASSLWWGTAPGEGHEPPKLDASVAHVARVYNYWLGGKDHFAADREAGDEAIRAYPDMYSSVRANRAFLRRAVRYLAAEAPPTASGGKLALPLFYRADDVVIAAVRLMRHPPYVDRRKTARCANVNGRRVRGADILPPLSEVAEDRDSADVDVNPFWHVDINVPEGQQDGHGRPRPVDGGFAQIEVQVSQGGSCESPAA